MNRGNPAQTGRRLGQGERSPSNKPYLQRVTEWTAPYTTRAHATNDTRTHERRLRYVSPVERDREVERQRGERTESNGVLEII